MWKEDDNEPLGWIGLNQFEDATSKEEYTKECLIPDSEKWMVFNLKKECP